MSISTLLGFQLYGNNVKQSLQRTAAEPVVAADQAYYNANIGKVKTVADLVNNYRLLSYATRAFGLQDMTYAKSLLTKVLTSDLSNPKSLANTLKDSRYAAFATAFNFGTDGTLKTTAQLQTSTQQSATEALFKARTTLSAADAATATTNFETAMKSITSLSQLESNPTALGYVLVAYGIDPAKAASTFEQTLESDLSNKTSFVNQQAGSGYLALSKAVQVNADGSAATVTEAESAANVTATTAAYLSKVASTTKAATAAATETNYFLSKITRVTTAADITGDSRMTAYLVKAYNLPETATASDLQKALTSDANDASSFARTSPYAGFLDIAKAFNFTATGAAGTVKQFQSDSQQQATSALYAARQTSDSASTAAETAYYKANIGKVTSVGDLEGDSRLLAYMETAYGIDPQSSTATITAVLENTGNIATTTANASLLALKLAFNIDTAGNTTNPLTAQSLTNANATVNAYMANAKTDAASQAAAKAASAYYQTAIRAVNSVSDLLADARLTTYVKQAYGLPVTTSNDTLRKILTSDVTNKKSYAVTTGLATERMAAAFDFNTKGLLAPEAQQAQSKAQLDAINAAYIEQKMETEAGARNPGIALALYFQANASKVTDAYSILADRKLMTVMRTILGLPASTSGSDIDNQAKTIKSQINLADLKNPAKVKALIQRFSILYDLNPPATDEPLTTSNVLSGTTQSYDATSLFGG